MKNSKRHSFRHPDGFVIRWQGNRHEAALPFLPERKKYTRRLVAGGRKEKVVT